MACLPPLLSLLQPQWESGWPQRLRQRTGHQLRRDPAGPAADHLHGDADRASETRVRGRGEHGWAAAAEAAAAAALCMLAVRLSQRIRARRPTHGHT